MNQVTGHLRIYEGKRGRVFYAKVRLADGKQIQRKIGPEWTGKGRPPAGHFTKRTAQVELEAILTDARRGTLAALRTDTDKTFGDACAEWLRYGEHDRQLAPSTLRDYRNSVHCHLLPEFGVETPITRIDTDRVTLYRDRLLDEGQLSRRSIQKLLVMLHGIFKRSKRNKWISENPADDVERVRVARSGDFNVLTPAEVMETARAAESGLLAAAITVAAFTGLRLGELRALRWDDVDFSSRMILVRRNQPAHGPERAPKSGKVRSVPLIDQAARALDDLSRRPIFTDPGDRVFCSATGGVWDDVPIRRGFYRALDAAGLGALRETDDPIVFHDLRHTFGTLGAAIWPLHNLQGYMGHADIQTTMIYVHHVPKVEAADQLSRAVEAALSPNLVPNFVPNSTKLDSTRTTAINAQSQD